MDHGHRHTTSRWARLRETVEADNRLRSSLRDDLQTTEAARVAAPRRPSSGTAVAVLVFVATVMMCTFALVHLATTNEHPGRTSAVGADSVSTVQPVTPSQLAVAPTGSANNPTDAASDFRTNLWPSDSAAMSPIGQRDTSAASSSSSHPSPSTRPSHTPSASPRTSQSSETFLPTAEPTTEQQQPEITVDLSVALDGQPAGYTLADHDGETVSSGTMNPGQSARYTDTAMRLTLSQTSGVTLTVDGRPITLPATTNDQQLLLTIDQRGVLANAHRELSAVTPASNNDGQHDDDQYDW